MRVTLLKMVMKIWWWEYYDNANGGQGCIIRSILTWRCFPVLQFRCALILREPCSGSWRTMLWFSENCAQIKIFNACLFKGSQEQSFFLQTLLFTAFLATVLKILTYPLVSTWSLVSSHWEHVKRKMHPRVTISSTNETNPYSNPYWVDMTQSHSYCYRCFMWHVKHGLDKVRHLHSFLLGLSLFLFAILLTSLVGVNHLRPKWDSPSKPGEDSRQAHRMGGNKKIVKQRMGRNAQHNEKY